MSINTKKTKEMLLGPLFKSSPVELLIDQVKVDRFTGFKLLGVHIASPRTGAEYCDDRVCLSVCLCLCGCVSVCPHRYLRNLMSDLLEMFLLVTRGLGSVLLGRRFDTLSTSGFVDDVMSARNGLYL